MDESNIVIDLADITEMYEFDEDNDPSQIFSHYQHAQIYGSDPDRTQRFRHFARGGFCTSFQSRARELATTATWPTPSNLVFSFSNTTGLVTMSYSQTFSVTWSADVGRDLFGFSSDRSGSTSYAATRSPIYCVNCSLADVSDESLPYEPSGIASVAYDDTGGSASIARTASPLFKDWVQEFEGKENTIRSVSGEIFVRWNHQRLFEHCRTGYPFVLYGDDRVGDAYGAAQVFSLRSDGVSFEPQRHSPGNASQFRIPYRCVFEGVAAS